MASGTAASVVSGSVATLASGTLDSLRLMQPECLQQLGIQTWRHSQLDWVQKILDVQQLGVALLLLERSTEGLEAFVLCEACEMLATPWEMELARPESLHPLLARGV